MDVMDTGNWDGGRIFGVHDKSSARGGICRLGSRDVNGVSVKGVGKREMIERMYSNGNRELGRWQNFRST